VASEARKQHIRQMMAFLRGKMRSPDAAGEVIVSRGEVEELARSIGMDEEAAWRMFRVLKGPAWEGQYMEESRSEGEASEYTAARLTRVYTGPIA
jgi:hypothetical protein